MGEKEFSVNGMLIATLFAFIGTVGHFLTKGRVAPEIQFVWLAAFVLAILTCSASSVNFDLKRIIR